MFTGVVIYGLKVKKHLGYSYILAIVSGALAFIAFIHSCIQLAKEVKQVHAQPTSAHVQYDLYQGFTTISLDDMSTAPPAYDNLGQDTNSFHPVHIPSPIEPYSIPVYLTATELPAFYMISGNQNDIHESQKQPL